MKNLIIWILFSLAVPLPGFGQSPAPVHAEEATAAISQLREGLVASFEKGDVDGLVNYLDPSVIVTWQNGEICRGPEAVRAFYHRMMSGNNRIVREIKSAPEVIGRHVEGDWAVSWGNLHDRFVLNDGSDLPLNSVFTATIAKRGDRWLVTAFHASVNAFENPVLALATRKTALWLGLGGGTVGLLLGFVGANLLSRKKSVA